MEHLGVRLTRKKTPQTPRSKTADYLVEKPRVTGLLYCYTVKTVSITEL